MLGMRQRTPRRVATDGSPYLHGDPMLAGEVLREIQNTFGAEKCLEEMKHG